MLRSVGAAFVVLHMAASASAATVASAYVHLNLRITGAEPHEGIGAGRASGSTVPRMGASALGEYSHDLLWTADTFSMSAEVRSGAELPGSEMSTYAKSSGSFLWENMPDREYWRKHTILPASTVTFEITYDVFAEALADGDPGEDSAAYVDLDLSTTFWATMFGNLKGTDVRITERVIPGNPAVRRQGTIVETVEVPARLRTELFLGDLRFQMIASANVASFATIIEPVAPVPVPLPGTMPIVLAASGALLVPGLFRRGLPASLAA